MKKILLISVLMVLLTAFSASATVLLNNIPADIVIRATEPVSIPFFISSNNRMVEVYLLASFKNTALYYDGSRWVSISPIFWQAFIRPAIDFIYLPEYIFGSFIAFESIDKDFDITLCIDSILNGVFDRDSSECATRRVLVR